MFFSFSFSLKSLLSLNLSLNQKFQIPHLSGLFTFFVSDPTFIKGSGSKEVVLVSRVLYGESV